jgi:hypothetical protein
MIWDCEQRHLARRKTKAVSYPDRQCKSKGVMLENEMRFKNQVKAAHCVKLTPNGHNLGEDDRGPPESMKFTPKIILI